MAMANMVRPTVSVLSPEQVEEIHASSLKVLATTGIRVDSERARERFRRAIGAQAVDSDLVRIPGELVDWALEVAPRTVDLFDRRGEHAFRLPGQTRFGIGVTALYYQDPETDDVTPFTRRTLSTLVRMGDALRSFDLISTPGIIQDVPEALSDLYATLEMAANTVKPLVLLVSDEDGFPDVLDLLEYLHGDLAERPFVTPYLNPITPLAINEGTVDKLWSSIERGLPVIYSNYGMAGASTPIKPAGTLVLLNAELLAGLVLGQLIREGSPMILGSLPAWFDMKGKGSFYAPASFVVALSCAEMMAHYGLPHCGTSGSGMGWGPDLITAGQQWTNHLLACMGKMGLAPFVGDCLGSLAFSPATLVYADDVIAQARMLAAGFELGDLSLSLDEADLVGPGGNFLISEQTLKGFRTATHRSELYENLLLEEWQARGQPRAEDHLRRYTAEMLPRLIAPADHQEMMVEGQAFISRRTQGTSSGRR